MNPRWYFHSWTRHVGSLVQLRSGQLKQHWHEDRPFAVVQLLATSGTLLRSQKGLCESFSHGSRHQGRQSRHQSSGPHLSSTVPGGQQSTPTKNKTCQETDFIIQSADFNKRCECQNRFLTSAFSFLFFEGDGAELLGFNNNLTCYEIHFLSNSQSQMRRLTPLQWLFFVCLFVCFQQGAIASSRLAQLSIWTRNRWKHLAWPGLNVTKSFFKNL